MSSNLKANVSPLISSLNNVPPGMSFKNLAISTTLSDCLTVILLFC